MNLLRLPYLTRILAATASASSQQPHTRASIPCQELRREREEPEPRSSWRIPQSERDYISWYRRPNGQQQLQPAERRTRTYGNGRLRGGRCQPPEHEHGRRSGSQTSQSDWHTTTTVEFIRSYVRRGTCTGQRALTVSSLCYDAWVGG